MGKLGNDVADATQSERGLSREVREIARGMLLSVAKGCGLEPHGVMLGSRLSGGVILKDGIGYWNPLASDADSRYVQAVLKIDLFFADEEARAVGPMTQVCTCPYNDAGGDSESTRATRRLVAARVAVMEAASLVCEARAKRLALAQPDAEAGGSAKPD